MPAAFCSHPAHCRARRTSRDDGSSVGHSARRVAFFRAVDLRERLAGPLSKLQSTCCALSKDPTSTCRPSSIGSWCARDTAGAFLQRRNGTLRLPSLRLHPGRTAMKFFRALDWSRCSSCDGGCPSRASPLSRWQPGAIGWLRGAMSCAPVVPRCRRAAPGVCRRIPSTLSPMLRHSREGSMPTGGAHGRVIELPITCITVFVLRQACLDFVFPLPMAFPPQCSIDRRLSPSAVPHPPRQFKQIPTKSSAI